MTMRSYRAKKGCKISTSYPALHRVRCESDKETVKVSNVKIGLRFKNLYYNIEKKKMPKLSAMLRGLSLFLKMLLVFCFITICPNYPVDD